MEVFLAALALVKLCFHTKTPQRFLSLPNNNDVPLALGS